MHISPSTYRKLYTIDRTIRTIMRVCTVICFVTIIAIVLPTPYKQLCAYAFFTTLGIICLLAMVRVCLSWFVKSDEEEEFEQKTGYILKQVNAGFLQTESQPALDSYTPLCNLTPEQEEAVIGLLRRLPSNPRKTSYINLAFISQYLTALEKMGYADLTNKPSLRLWVNKVTGKDVPTSSEFNAAIPSTVPSKISNASKAIEKILR